MITKFLSESHFYDGTAIHSLWAYHKAGVQGDSLVAFLGGCDIPSAHMVDQEDVRGGKSIRSPEMLHFIEESFGGDLERAVWRQRLLAVLVQEEIRRRAGREIERRGDDLFDADRKLSISIATVTPVSTKIHFGVNVRRAEGLDVPTEGLSTYGVDPRDLGEAVLRRYAGEVSGVRDARTRVRGVP